MDRDGNTCRICNQIATTAHHILSFTKYPLMRFDIDNGIAICKKCHKEKHSRHDWINIVRMPKPTDF